MSEKKKTIGLTAATLAVTFVITAVTIYLYKNIKPASDMIFFVIQNVAYILMGLVTFVFMKLSGKSLGEFGLHYCLDCGIILGGRVLDR